MRTREALAALFTGFWFGKTAVKVATAGFFLKKAKESFVRPDEKQDDEAAEEV